jgi:hypothetical protein
MSSEMKHRVVWYKFDVSGVLTASIIRMIPEDSHLQSILNSLQAILRETSSVEKPSVSQTVVRGGPQGASEENALQNLYQTLNE